MSIIDRIFGILEPGTMREYGRDPVTQHAHALQRATLAERTGASSASIAASLTHDIGHLPNLQSEGARDRGEDARHEMRAAGYLANQFNDDVVAPVRWHVDAERRLTATEQNYYDTLSAGSKKSLTMQGGPFDPADVAAFAVLPYISDAVQRRRWDDGVKVQGAATPDLAYFRPHLERCLKE